MTEKYYRVSHTDLKELMEYAIYAMAVEETPAVAAEVLRVWSEEADEIIEDVFEEIA